MTPALASRLSARGTRSARPEGGPVTLTQRRIFILPSRAGLLFAATVLLMLLGCVNYNLGLGYLLTFLVSGVGVASILHTYRNLSQLQIRAGRAEPVFVGDEAQFTLVVVNPVTLPRLSIGLAPAERDPVFVDVAPAASTTAGLRVPAQRRGRLPLGRVRVFTTYPLGLFYAWSNLELDLHCLVYPRPEAGRVPLPAPRVGEAEGLEAGQGQDDFAGLRKYQPGDSLRHVAWKAVARGQPVMTKQFSGLAAGELWLEWNALPADLRIEARLSRLTRWVLDAASAGVAYGLRLPSLVIAPATGPSHREQCLAALALFQP